MFLKRLSRRKRGKKHTYWALVETVRTARGPRHRVVAYLGELKKSQRSGWAKLGRKLDKKDRPERWLFDPPPHEEPDEDRYVHVNLKGVRLERLRDFGDVWLALGLWRLLGLAGLLARSMPSGKEDVPWAHVAAILTIARFCEPSSERHIEETWYPRTALEDLLGVAPKKVHTDRLYEGLDRLLPHKEAIESHLKRRLGELFDVKYDLLLYDIGLIVTTDGMPLGYEVFDGNTNDSTTVQQMVEQIEAKYGRAHRVWVMDRGMVSEANLAFLRERGGSYIVGTPKAMLRQFERHLTEKDWQEVQAGVEVKLVAGPESTETFILARSKDRREKERAMHDRFLQGMEEALGRMQRSAESGRLKDPAVAHERLGRLKQRYWRALGAFDVKIREIPEPTGKAKWTVTWKRNPRWSDWAAISEGCYLLRTNLTEADPCTLWKHYIQLTEAEWAFRITKDELEIRPIWHQKPQRVLAHILVCFLAYVLWKSLAQWMRASGLGDAPRTLLEEFARIKSGDVVLPTRRSADQPTRTLRLRCVTTADEHQRVFLSRLGLELPQRLRWIEEIPTAPGP